MGSIEGEFMEMLLFDPDFFQKSLKKIIFSAWAYKNSGTDFKLISSDFFRNKT